MQVNNYVSPPKHDRMSTSQLKKALEKIKQTQLEVLSALKNQADGQNQNEANLKLGNQNAQVNIPYVKSISHLNLLKMSEVNNMRKEFQRERERYNDKIDALQQKIKALQSEVELKRKLEGQWNQERNILHSKIKDLQQVISKSSKNISSQAMIKAQVKSYQEELTGKILQDRFNEVHEEKQFYKNKYEKLAKETVDKEKNRPEKNMKASHHLQKNKLPLEEMITEVKKIQQGHEKVYQSLKTRARITVNDLEAQQELQQSMTRLSNIIQSYQKQLHQDKRVIEMDDSVIQGFKGYDSQSFRDEVKKFDKEMFEREHLKKEITELRAEILQSKQQKSQVEFELFNIKKQHNLCQQKLKSLEKKYKESYSNEYDSLMKQLESEMKNIRQQKNTLANLVKKISENAFKSNDEEFNKNLRDQIAKIMEINEDLRQDNQKYKVMIDSLNITIQGLKYQHLKYEDEQHLNKVLLEKQTKEKQLYIEEKNKIERQLHQKESIAHSLQQKINELNMIIQINSKKYEGQLTFKVGEITSLRQQLQKSMKQLRNLRQVAYSFQLTSAENESLKRRLMQVNSSIIHLWQIKQTEYSNIFSVLSQLKKQ